MDYAQFSVPTGQTSQLVSVTSTSAASTVLTSPEVLVTVTAVCFVVRGETPTAVANTSMALAPNVPYRLGGFNVGVDKLAFITATTASAYITPIT